uniref:Uncharacterized protein n=1 Tax=Phlebotomus papatasi TaxID=29031 RepID=A0A1B0DQX9_PHLPP
MKKNVFLWVFLSCWFVVGGYNNGIDYYYYWWEVNYENLPFADDTQIGPYPYHIPSNNNILGITYHDQSGLMITTVGRLRPGVPSTLNAFCVAEYNQGTSPHLWGFPDYEKNTLKEEFYAGGDQSRKFNKQDKYSTNYHNYYQNNNYNDFSIISVYHPIADDRCNRLFAVDTGLLRYGPNEPIYN